MLMDYSRQLYLSDCARLVEYKPSLVVDGVVDEGTGACGKITCGGSTSLAEGIYCKQPNRPSPPSLRPNPENIGSRIPIEDATLPIRRCVNTIQRIVDMECGCCRTIPVE